MDEAEIEETKNCEADGETGPETISAELTKRDQSVHSSGTHNEKGNTKEKSVACDICSKTFFDKKKLWSHKSSVHKCDKSKHQCSYCTYSCARLKDLDMHMRVHTGERPFKCTWPGCDERFKQKSNVQVHYRKHTGEKPFSCTECDKHFRVQGALQQHIITNHTAQEDRQKLKIIICEDCGVAFESLYQLKSHKLNVHTSATERPFSCSICPTKFTTASNLKQHENTHLGIQKERPHVCSTCGYNTSFLKDLERHIRIHTGEKPYACETCGKKFKDKCNLRSHMQVHNGRGPLRYECPVCHKKGYDKSNMRKHMKIHGESLDLIDLEDSKTRKRLKIVSENERKFIEDAREDRENRKKALKQMVKIPILQAPNTTDSKFEPNSKEGLQDSLEVNPTIEPLDDSKNERETILEEKRSTLEESEASHQYQTLELMEPELEPSPEPEVLSENAFECGAEPESSHTPYKSFQNKSESEVKKKRKSKCYVLDMVTQERNVDGLEEKVKQENEIAINLGKPFEDPSKEYDEVKAHCKTDFDTLCNKYFDDIPPESNDLTNHNNTDTFDNNIEEEKSRKSKNIAAEDTHLSPNDPSENKMGRPRTRPIAKYTKYKEGMIFKEFGVQGKPGRPRKHSLTDSKCHTYKAKRGRPRKRPIAEDIVFKELGVKRKPGRPRKHPLADSESKEIEITRESDNFGIISKQSEDPSGQIEEVKGNLQTNFEALCNNYFDITPLESNSLTNQNNTDDNEINVEGEKMEHSKTSFAEELDADWFPNDARENRAKRGRPRTCQIAEDMVLKEFDVGKGKQERSRKLSLKESEPTEKQGKRASPKVSEVCGQVKKTDKKDKKNRQKISQEAKLSRNPVYQCNECKKMYYERCGLRKHILQCHTFEANVTCNVCQKTFSNKNKLWTHNYGVHRKENNIKCPKCSYTCSKEAILRVHMLKHTGEKPVECSWEGCDKRFKTKGGMKVHYMNHTGEKSFTCEECGKCFKSKAILQGHSVIHMDPEKRKTLKTNICEDCGGAFASSSYLKSHRKFHCSVLSVEKHFSCSICPSRFTTSSLLKHHESRHSEDRPIKCTRENCDKRFKNKRDLKIHLDRHDGKFSIYQYPCRHCEKKFQTSWARTTHERLHTGEKPYSCKLCDYKCADVSNMKKHERNKHKELQQN